MIYITQGQTKLVSIPVDKFNEFSSGISFSASSPQGSNMGISLNPVSLLPGKENGVLKVSISASSGTAAGVYDIVITGEPAARNVSVTIPVTVSIPADYGWTYGTPIEVPLSEMPPTVSPTTTVPGSKLFTFSLRATPSTSVDGYYLTTLFPDRKIAVYGVGGPYYEPSLTSYLSDFSYGYSSYGVYCAEGVPGSTVTLNVKVENRNASPVFSQTVPITFKIPNDLSEPSNPMKNPQLFVNVKTSGSGFTLGTEVVQL